MSRLAQYKYKIAIFASLLFSTALCIAMVAVRIVYARQVTHALLTWNLFLAWVPLGCALAACSFYTRRTITGYAPVVICAVVWLVFFPNALYTMTDLLHLQPQDNIPIWFDLILILSFAWTSYLLGIVSLYLMQDLVSSSMGKWAGWLFVLATLGLGSIGVYLGRFLRLNSWDLFMQPGSLLASIWEGLSNPLAHPRTLVFCILFALFFISTYLTLFTLTRLPQERSDLR